MKLVEPTQEQRDACIEFCSAIIARGPNKDDEPGETLAWFLARREHAVQKRVQDEVCSDMAREMNLAEESRQAVVRVRAEMARWRERAEKAEAELQQQKNAQERPEMAAAWAHARQRAEEAFEHVKSLQDQHEALERELRQTKQALAEKESAVLVMAKGLEERDQQIREEQQQRRSMSEFAAKCTADMRVAQVQLEGMQHMPPRELPGHQQVRDELGPYAYAVAMTCLDWMKGKLQDRTNGTLRGAVEESLAHVIGDTRQELRVAVMIIRQLARLLDGPDPLVDGFLERHRGIT